jgi:hypothetical protein
MACEKGALGMKHGDWSRFLTVLLIAVIGLCMIGGCDSGKEAIDEATGHRALKQYHKSKKDIEKIAEKQAERYEGIPDDEEREGEKKNQ